MAENALEESSALRRQIDSLAAEVGSEHGAADSARAKRGGTRFVGRPPDGDFEFSSDGVATLTFGRLSGASRPLVCKVQESAEGPVPVGSILVPVARHLVRGKLDIEFHVLRLELCEGTATPWRVRRLEAHLTDHFIVDEGAIFCIELEGSDFADSGFRTHASMRMTGVPGESPEARLCCVIVCVARNPT